MAAAVPSAAELPRPRSWHFPDSQPWALIATVIAPQWQVVMTALGHRRSPGAGAPGAPGNTDTHRGLRGALGPADAGCAQGAGALQAAL